MMAGGLCAGQARVLYVMWKGFAGRSIMVLLCFLLLFGVFSRMEAEAAAVPTKEEITGTYHSDPRVSVKFEGDTLIFGGLRCTYDPATGIAKGKDIWLQFTKDANGKISIYGEQLLRGYEPPINPNDTEENRALMESLRIPDETVVYMGPKEGEEEVPAENKEKEAEPMSPVADLETQGKESLAEESDHYPETYEEEGADLPESDAGKAAAAVGTAVGGALLGVAGAFGGLGGGGGYGGFARGEGGPYDEGGTELPDNMAVAEDGSIHITTPTGETLVYTPNADGSYNLPTRTETGEGLTYQDEDGNWRTVEPGTISQKDVLEGARWYKDHEQELRDDRAVEDARQQAERDRLAHENAAWLEKQHEINNQLSQTSIDLANELRQMDTENQKAELLEKLRWKYAHGDESLSKDDLMKIVEKEQIKNNIEGGMYEQEAAAWDNHVITAQEFKFAADQAVNAYGILSHNQAFANAYSALTNYTETMMDAAVNQKDMKTAFIKATVDTGLDVLANKFEDHGWHITGNAFSGAYKQVNDNIYNGRDAWAGTDEAAVKGGVMGTVSKGIAKLGEMSQGTVLGQEIGGSGTKTKVDLDTGSHQAAPDVDAKGVRKTTIAERRAGEGVYKTDMTEADAKLRISEDVQANRSMNEVRKLNKISEKMSAIEKSDPRNYQSNPEYQKLSQELQNQHKVIREDKVALDRMNALTGEKGIEVRQRYNEADMAYEKEVLQIRNESIAESTGLKQDQIGDFHATTNKDAVRAAGGAAAHDLDTSPNVKVDSGTENHKSVDFTQVDGDHHLAKAVYKAEYGRYPQTAAEYDEALRLKQVRDFTNVSTRPSDTHETYRNPDAYVGSGKGEVDKVLHPDQYGTPDKGTGAFNEQTAIHKQGAPLERHQQQYAEAQKLREQLNTDTSLSAAEKTEMGKKIAYLEKQSASNHYESTRTTVKEQKVIDGINDVNIKNGLGDGVSDDARYISELASQVKEGKLDNAVYKQIVTKMYGSEENAQKIIAEGFRNTNK